MGEVIKSYKGFNKNMTCRGFQYEEGKEYEEEIIEVCDHGFHACEYPLDCLNYYYPNESVYHEVEQSGEIQKHNDDTKVASTKIKIGAEISIAGLVKAAIEYTVKRVKRTLKAMKSMEHPRQPETMEHPRQPETVEHPRQPDTVEHPRQKTRTQ